MHHSVIRRRKQINQICVILTTGYWTCCNSNHSGEGGVLKVKGGYDVWTWWTLKIDPEQIFGHVQNTPYTKNFQIILVRYFTLFLSLPHPHQEFPHKIVKIIPLFPDFGCLFCYLLRWW